MNTKARFMNPFPGLRPLKLVPTLCYALPTTTDTGPSLLVLTLPRGNAVRDAPRRHLERGSTNSRGAATLGSIHPLFRAKVVGGRCRNTWMPRCLWSTRRGCEFSRARRLFPSKVVDRSRAGNRRSPLPPRHPLPLHLPPRPEKAPRSRFFTPFHLIPWPQRPPRAGSPGAPDYG